MNTRFQRRLERASRVLEFVLAHPLDSPAYVTARDRFRGNIQRAEAIDARQHQGIDGSKAARARRRELRHTLQDIGNYLVAVVQVAAKGEPGLAEPFKAPDPRSSHRDFLSQCKGYVANATPIKALLIAKGMSESSLDDLARLTGEYEAVNDVVRTGRRQHLGARVDCELVHRELSQDIKVFSGMYHVHLGNDEVLLGEWDAVRHIPFQPQARPAPEVPQDVAPPAPPAPPARESPAA